jgi:hypothetical protein
LNLEIEFPSIHKEFLDGHFAVQQTNRTFSSVALDQALEQGYNKPAKSTGGIIGMTRRKDAVAKHDLIRHEKVGISNFHHNFCGIIEESEYELHHEFSKSIATQDQGIITKMIKFISEHKNPFQTDCNNEDLFNLITGESIKEEEKMHKLKCLEKGEALYKTFIEERFMHKTKNLFDPIRKQCSKTVTNPLPKPSDVEKETKQALRYNLQVYS